MTPPRSVDLVPGTVLKDAYGTYILTRRGHSDDDPGWTPYAARLGGSGWWSENHPDSDNYTHDGPQPSVWTDEEMDGWMNDEDPDERFEIVHLPGQHDFWNTFPT